MTKQLLLPFGLTQGYAKEDFCPAPSNALAREWLGRPEGWSNNRLILWGDAGCGKTHLLRIWAAEQRAALFEGSGLDALPGRVEHPVAIDDADIVEDPRALLHLLNSAAEAGQPVLLTARHPPARQAQKLADLASRLRASTAVEIRPPEAELLDRLLMRLAAERQLVLSPGVKNFMLTRLPRTPAVLREAVARLDRAALDRGVRITRALAADILAGLAGFDTEAQVLSNGHSPPGEGLL
jgi:chromosomal replication initiation ATPase DnaA